MTKPTRKLICSKCGAKAQATCGCGAVYETAGIVAAKAIAKHPEWSNRLIAEKTGVDESTVRAIRKKGAGNPALRMGRDGKIHQLAYHLVPRRLRNENLLPRAELEAVPVAVELIRKLTPAMDALRREIEYHEATISPREVGHLVRDLLIQINNQRGWSTLWKAEIYEDCALGWEIDETKLNDEVINAVRKVAAAWDDLAERMLTVQKETKTVSQPTHYIEEARPGNGAAPTG